MTFDGYWSTVDEELSRFPARPVLTPMPGRSTSEYTGYEVHFSGLDSYRLFGYLSVPAGRGLFPGLLELPRHGSVNNAPHHIDRLRYVVLTAMHRGQRRADSPFAAAYPGLYTRGITDPGRYVYRAIVADCLRAAEVLLARPELDTSRVGVTGDDLALLTAARRPRFTAVQVREPLLHEPLRRRLTTSDYPLEELNDHLRHRPADQPRLEATLSLFEPARHACIVTAPTLLALPSEGPQWSDRVIAALGDRLVPYRLTDEDAVDVRAIDAWLAGRLGVPAMAKFAA